MKRSVRISLILWALVFLLALSGCTNSELQNLEAPHFEDVTVHDPSVMSVDDTHYIVGSHLASAKSKDLMAWKQISTDVHGKLVPNIRSTLNKSLDWAKTETLWASDWIYLEETQKYHLYYCACEGNSPRSVLGVLTADNPEGPYTDPQVILKSGMEGESENKGETYNPKVHPNAIDPHVFFDKDDELWMVYGSYSGGIYILKMDPKTGLPFDDQGYGKHLLGGNHSQIEAPYILYNEEADYYYLFVSYGALDYSGGYQIRVFRSKNPDGPYEDRNGKQAENVRGSLNAIKNSGVKLIGNFTWGLDDDLATPGYVSPGHNSTLFEQDLDKYFLIFHTRFEDLGEFHQVRVHEILFDDEAWPLISPFRYAGNATDKFEINADDVNGKYRMINHGREIGSAITKPKEYEFHEGDINGGDKGTYSSKAIRYK